MDVFFKHLHKSKGTFGMSTTAQRAENLNSRRRETRGNLMLERRNIDKNMTPLPTPEPTRTQPKVPEPKRNKRLEMLQKWKEEKERLKKLEQKNKKPVFKVSAVHNEIGLPNLDKVNQTIKGKFMTPIRNEFTRQSRFRSVNVVSKNMGSKKNVNNSQEAQKTNGRATGTNYNSSNQSKSKNSAMTQWKESRVQSVQNDKVPKNSTNRNAPPIVARSSPRRQLTPFRRLGQFVDKKTKTPPDQVELRIIKSAKKNRKSIIENKKVSIIDLTESPLEDKVSSNKKIRKTPYLTKPKKNTKIRSPFIEAKNLSQRFLRSSSKISSVTSSEETDSPLEDEVFEKENYEDHELNETFDIEDNNTDQNSCSGICSSLSEKAEEENKKRKKNSKHSIVTPNIEKNPKHTKNTPRSSKQNIVTLNIEKTPKDIKTKSRVSPGSSKQHIVTPNTEKKPKHTKNRPRSSKQNIVAPNIEKTPKDTKSKSRKSSRKDTKPYQKSLSDSNLISEREKTSPQDRQKKSPIENENDNATTNSRKITRSTRRNKKSLSIIATESISTDHPLSNVSAVENNSDCTAIVQHNKTPDNKGDTSPVDYLSPFVTVSRGKNSARKEFRARNSRTDTLSKDSMISRLDDSSTSPKTGAMYFKKLLTKETERIESMCAVWSDYKEITQPNESACDLINTTVGQARLLTSSKFKQFDNLINRCEDGDNMVTCQDLHGFWEMMYQQVGDVEKRFQNLERLRESGWEEVIVERVNKDNGRAAANKKKRPQDAGKGKRMRNEHLREAIKAARLKSQHSKTGADEANNSAFGVNFFMAGSPLMKHGSNSVRKSLLASALSNSTKRRSGNADHIGRVVMATNQTVRRSFGTPAKSILKTDGSVKKHNKSVLFEDCLQIDDKENAADLLDFSPVGTPVIRRSSRIRISRNKLF